MKSKVVFVLGVGIGKLVPVLFGFFLSRQFGAGGLAGFVLVLTYSAALSAVSNLGSVPRIIRAGAHANINLTILRAVLSGLLIQAALLAISLIYWILFSDDVLLHALDSPKLEQAWVVLCSLGLVLYSMAHAIYSAHRAYLRVGLSSIAIYGGAAIAGWLAGSVADVEMALNAYFSIFFLVSLLFFISSQRIISREWRQIGSLLIDAVSDLKQVLITSLFGVITQGGFYLMMNVVQRDLPTGETATFALAFQLFQAGIFLPSVLGSVVVPRMVSVYNDGLAETKIQLERQIQRAYLLIGIIWLVVITCVANLLLALYGLDNSGALGLIVLQFSALLAAQQAFYIQHFVALGRFGLLAFVSLIWAASGLGFLWVAPVGILYVVFAFLFAYFVSLCFYALFTKVLSA